MAGKAFLRAGPASARRTSRMRGHAARNHVRSAAMSGLLEGKHLLITGVINHESIAFAVARLAQEQGAHIVLTGHGRLHMVESTARRLPRPPPVIELEVPQTEQLARLAERLRVH